MTNQVLPPPEIDEVRNAPERELHLLNPVVDEPVWTTIFKDVRGLFNKEKLPPLVLTSTPIAVPDPFQVKRSPTSTTVAIITHVAVIAFFVWLALYVRTHQKPVPPKQLAAVDITPFRPIAPAGAAMGGGGGGGAHEMVQAPKGRLHA